MDLKRWKIFANLSPSFAANVKSAYIIGIDSPRGAAGASGQEIPRCRAGVMAMKSGDIYSVALTSDDLSMLGVAEFEDLTPLVPVKIDALCGQGIRAISSGYRHVAALTMDGRVYEWGSMFLHEQWIPVNPQFISGNLECKKVVHVACGRMHKLALTSEGEVYAWGSNRRGQLGIPSRTDEIQPVKVSSALDTKVVSVACGGWTSFALDNEGNVWSWGYNLRGALGFDATSDQPFPRQISLRNIKQIAAGKHHVLALSSEEKLYFWGQHTKPETSVVTPQQIGGPNVVDIGVVRGCSVSAFKTTEGKVYFWGFAFGHLIREPVATEFASLDELFASLDTPVMLRSPELNLEQPAVLIRKLRLSFDDHETGDVKFSLEGKSIHAHKMFLKLRSDHFKRMFDNNWKENNDHEAVVEISGFTYTAFRTFLLYLYTEVIQPLPHTAEDAIELFKLGDYYGEEEFKRCCEQYLKLLTTSENFDKVFSLAVQYNAEGLLNIVLDFVIPNFNVVVKSEGYRKMPDELKNRLIEEIATEDAFAGMKRMSKKE